MLTDVETFSSYATNDLEAAKVFYRDILGLNVTEDREGLLSLHFAGNRNGLIYYKADFMPATFTVFNFLVPDIDEAVDWMTEQGVVFERYEGFPMDEKGIHRQENVAWFKDPAGNILAVMIDPMKSGS